MPLIQVNNLTRQFQMGNNLIKALDRIELAVEANEFLAIMGPSGSGKSTLMNVIGCLDRPDEGHVILDGKPVSKLSDEELAAVRNRSIGFVFQTFHLLPRMDATQNVMLPLIYGQTPVSLARTRALEMLDRVGLHDRSTHRPHELSGGQRQRVAIARALVNEPSVVLADEPTGNLDSKTTTEIMDLLADLHKEGQTIMMVTHDPEIAARAQKVVYMCDGRIERIEHVH